MQHFLRKFRFTYILYNIFQRKFLKYNIKRYKLLGISKKYYSSISSADFKGIDPGLLKEQSTFEIDSSRADLDNIKGGYHKGFKDFSDNGYMIIKNFLDEKRVDQINGDIELSLSKNELKYTYGNRIMDAVWGHHSIKTIAVDKDLNLLLAFLIGGTPKLFQSINFLKGSQQASHSDSIHMTTFPVGGLLGVWIALEDVDEDNGPLHYYPGSHKLPYYLNSDYDNEGNYLMIGSQSYTEYESMIKRKIEELGLEKRIFTANKGDMIIWHANLFHGGEVQKDTSRTRQSLVLHYFNGESICYHEITQRPAIMKMYA